MYLTKTVRLICLFGMNVTDLEVLLGVSTTVFEAYLFRKQNLYLVFFNLASLMTVLSFFGHMR